MYTYIVVDDEPLTRRGTIKKIGTFEDTIKCIGEASNGVEGLALIEELNPHIVITDMNMPIMDGSGFLQQISLRYPDKQIIVISGYKDFEYAKQAISARAINYILKPFNRDIIRSAIRDAINLIENKTELQNKIVSIEAEKEYAKYDYDLQTLKNLILGYHTTPLELISDKLRLIEQHHHFILMTIHSQSALEEALITDLIEENGFGDLGLYLPHLHSDKMGFFILFFPERTPMQLTNLCKQVAFDLINLLKNEHQVICVGISRPKPNIMQLNNAFKETVEALNSRTLSDTHHHYLFSEKNISATPLSWDYESEFLFRIEVGETERVTALINQFFVYFTSKEFCTLYELKHYCITLTEKTKVILSHYFENLSLNNQSASVQSILNSMFTFEEIKEYFLRFFSNISLSMASKSVYTHGDVIENIMTYVKRNYFNNITLEFISSLFYMNRSYCSHLFKKKTGQNFVDYVNAVRIKEAKVLLNTSDKKMYTIAKAVGYDNVKYFFRIFKKVTGITPEQYRKDLRYSIII